MRNQLKLNHVKLLSYLTEMFQALALCCCVDIIITTTRGSKCARNPQSWKVKAAILQTNALDINLPQPRCKTNTSVRKTNWRSAARELCESYMINISHVKSWWILEPELRLGNKSQHFPTLPAASLLVQWREAFRTRPQPVNGQTPLQSGKSNTGKKTKGYKKKSYGVKPNRITVVWCCCVDRGS